MHNILALETAHDLLCNDQLMVIEIIRVIINFAVVIHNNDTTIIDGREHINLCLNIAGRYIRPQLHIFTCRYLILPGLRFHFPG